MDHFFWAEAFGWTPSMVRAERAADMHRLAAIAGIAAEGREKRRKRDEKKKPKR